MVWQGTTPTYGQRQPLPCININLKRNNAELVDDAMGRHGMAPYQALSLLFVWMENIRA